MSKLKISIAINAECTRTEGIRMDEILALIKQRCDDAYCHALNKFRQAECLGWKAKVAAEMFGELELDAHCAAHELMGAHKALADLYKEIACLNIKEAA